MFRWADCMEGHILLGFALNVVSFVLLLLTTFSTPYIHSIYFLESQYGVQYGAFGYCEPEPAGCIGSTVGYDTGPEVTEWITRTHILFAIATLFMLLSLIALILSLLRVGKFMWEPRYFRTTALIGSISAIAAEIFALICWVTARHRFDQNGDFGRATYGAALWLGLVGAITGFIRQVTSGPSGCVGVTDGSACVGGPAYNGNYGMHWANRGVAYNV